MSDEDGVHIGRILTDDFQPFNRLATAEPGIDQQARPLSSNKRAISGAARSQDTELDDLILPLGLIG
jgi:hypothetical protein